MSASRGQVLSFRDGEWALYGSVDLGSGGVRAKAVELTVAAGAGGAMEVWSDPLADDGFRLARCEIPSTSGVETWQTVSCPLRARGSHEVYLRALGGKDEVLRLASLRFVPEPDQGLAPGLYQSV